MANSDKHRRFGSVRKLPSGRYQARYLGPDGLIRRAPETFARKPEAERYLTLVEAQMVRREWTDPERGKVRLAEYADLWITQRPKLRPRTVHLYRWVLGRHITPYLGATPLGRMDTPMIRDWRTGLLASGVSQTMTAKAYRLLRAILNTAVKEDEILRVNPCRVPGADKEEAGERPVLTIAQVLALADRVPDRYRALILLTTFACLRWGEAIALERQDIDAVAGTVRVRQAYTEQRGVGLVLGPPKSKAGNRTVAVPAVILPAIRSHLSTYVAEADDARVFTVPAGKAIWRGNFNTLVGWKAAASAIGVPGLHFHDLRHTGNTLAAKTGTSLRDLMTRMGHDDPRAALLYQHKSAEADQAIASAVNDQVKAEQKKAKKTTRRDRRKPDDGAAGVLAKVS